MGDHLWWTRIFGVAFFLFEDLLFECVLLFEELFLLMEYCVEGDTHFCGGNCNNFVWNERDFAHEVRIAMQLSKHSEDIII